MLCSIAYYPIAEPADFAILFLLSKCRSSTLHSAMAPGAKLRPNPALGFSVSFQWLKNCLKIAVSVPSITRTT